MRQKKRGWKLTASIKTVLEAAVCVECHVGIDSNQKVLERTAQQEGNEHHTDSSIHANNRV
jgi:hypothetical protein